MKNQPEFAFSQFLTKKISNIPPKFNQNINERWLKSGRLASKSANKETQK